MNITHEISNKYKMQGKILVDHLQGPHLPHATPFQPNLHRLSLSPLNKHHLLLCRDREKFI